MADSGEAVIFRRKLFRNRYLSREKDFSGTEIISSLTGDFVRGYSVENGKRVKRFTTTEANSTRISRKGIYPCGYEIIYLEEWICGGWDAGYWDGEDGGSGAQCGWEWVPYDVEVFCDDGYGGGGDSGGGGYDGDGGDDGCYDPCTCYGDCGDDCNDPCSCWGDCETHPRDCEGNVNGTAYTDACGDCVGGTTGKQPCDPNSPCGELAAIANNAVINNYMNSLIQGRMANDPNSEHGDLIRANGTYLQKTSGSTATYSFEPGVKYTHSFHSHTSGNWGMIFAGDADIYTLWKTYNGGHMHNVSDFVFGIIGDESSMIIKIENPAQFRSYITGLGSTEAAQELKLKTEFNQAVGIGTSQGKDTLLLKLANFCDGMGLRVMVSDGDIASREWHIYSENNNILEKNDCD